MTQAELYTVELLQKVESTGANFKIVKNTNNATGKIDFRAIPCNDEWQRINLMPIIIGTLEQVKSYVEEQTKDN